MMRYKKREVILRRADGVMHKPAADPPAFAFPPIVGAVGARPSRARHASAAVAALS
jgi:hypothetical protein